MKETDKQIFTQKPLYMRRMFLLHRRYRIGDVIDENDTDVIYLAWDTLIKRRVAVREYMPRTLAVRILENMEGGAAGKDEVQQFQDGLERFVAEAAYLAAHKDVPEIVDVFDSFMDNNTSYIVMEYLEGVTLEHYLRQEQMISPELSVRLLTAVIRLLEMVWLEDMQGNIVPENILVTKAGKIKLVRLLECAQANIPPFSNLQPRWIVV